VTYVVMAHGFYFFDDTATLPDASNWMIFLGLGATWKSCW
jgi:hypothetical protein